jgi:hypothetical protein
VLVIAGYAKPAMLAALRGVYGTKSAVLFSVTKQDDAPRSWWREISKKWIVKRYKAALVGGQTHKDYLVRLGMSADAIFFGYTVVGNDYYHPNKIRSLPVPLQRSYFLAINLFVPKKTFFFLGW